MSSDRSFTARVGVLCLAILLTPHGAHGAGEYETISGSVEFAESRLPAPEMRVTLFDLETLRPVTTLTDEGGRFELPVAGASSAGADFASPATDLASLPTQNFPNPFNPSTTIPFELRQPAHVSLEVFDILGQRVRALSDEIHSSGRHEIVWNGTDDSGRAVASGIYIYRLVVDGVPLAVRRMILIDGPPDSSPAHPAPAPIQERETTYGLTIAAAGIRMLVAEDLSLNDIASQSFTVTQALSLRKSSKVTGVAAGSGILGDVTGDGRVTITDALVVATYGIDNTVAPPEGGDMALGDVNADGRVDISDALIIASYSVDPTNPNLPGGIAEGVEPELSTYAVSGFVRNRAGEALQSAQVWLGPLTTVTDADGFYQLVLTSPVEAETIIVELGEYNQHAALLSLAGEDLSYSIELTPDALPTAVAEADADIIFTGESVTLRGGASSDPSGRGLSYQWSSVPTNPVGVDFPVNDSGEAFAVTVVLAESGEYNFKLVVDNGLASSEPDTVTVVANRSPVAVISTPADGETFEVGQTILLQGEGEDPDAGFVAPDRLSWFLGDGSVGTGSIQQLSDLQVGTHEISLAVIDVYGATDTVVISIEVVEAPPELTVIAISGDSQTVTINQPSAAFVVAIVDELQAGASGRQIGLNIVSGQGVLSDNTRITDAQGELATTITPTAMDDIVVEATSSSAAGVVQFSFAVAAAFADAALETAIRDVLAKPEGDIVAADIAMLIDLDASQLGVISLQGAELLTSLQSLNAGLNALVDLSPLAELSSLAELWLGSNLIVDLQPLANLPTLSTLVLQDNGIDDVSALSGITTLQTLILWGNEIADISPLAGLTGLLDLELNGNQITDISSLTALTDLQALDLSDNQVGDLSAIAGMSQLSELDLSENAVTSVGDLAGLSALTELNLSDNTVVIISALAGLDNLVDLDLSDNEISDVSAVSGMGSLVSLNLKRNKIADIEALVDNLDLGSGDDVDLRNNPLNQDAINIHIPALEARGVTVRQ